MQYSLLLSGIDWEVNEEKFDKKAIFSIFFAAGMSGDDAIARVHLKSETLLWFAISVVCFVLCFFALVCLVNFVYNIAIVHC